MTLVYMLAFAILIAFSIIYTTKYKLSLNVQNHLTVLVVIGVFARILVANNIDVYNQTDISCFKSWSTMLFDGGLSQFYKSDAFTDYPPGYMYVLYCLGFIRHILDLDYYSDSFLFLVKLPAMIFDILTSISIYKIACTRLTKENSFLCSLAYTLNPAIIINSAVWGQVDSIYTLVIFYSIYTLVQKHYFKSFFIFAVAVLLKPQAFIFSPIYMFAVYTFLKEHNFTMLAFKKLSIYAGVCLGFLFVSILPFAPNFDFSYVYLQYVDTLASYPYATLNAYNFYSLIGANWASIDQNLIFMPIAAWGFFFVVCIVILSLYLLRKFDIIHNYFFVAALINTLTFMFCVKMHERYIYPSLLLFLAAFIYSRERRLLLLFVGFSLTLFVNCADVLNMQLNGNSLYYLQNTIKPLSAANMLLSTLMVYFGFKCFKYENTCVEEEYPIEPIKPQKINLEITEVIPKLTKLDAILLGALILLYGSIAFTNLGDFKSPQTMWSANDNPDVVVDLGDIRHVSEIAFLLGSHENRSFELRGVSYDDLWTYEFTGTSVFAWHFFDVDMDIRYLEIFEPDHNLTILEFAVFDNGNLLEIESHTRDATNLFDEQHLVPHAKHFMNSTYFDEIYHARTAFEFIHSMPVYEWTHPPLGKVIIAAGIQMFGMTPFGFRFMGTLFGALMLPFMYMFAKSMFKSSYWAFFCAFIFAFDFMHFAQTRISTIDTYVTFFIIGMFYFMYRYYIMNFYTVPLKKTLIPLLLSGICFGLATASKWPGMYAGAGIAVIFFYSIYKRFSEFRHSNDDITLTQNFKNHTITTFAWCVLFFVIIPVGIYSLSYIPFLKAPDMNGISSIIQNQQSMYHYHSNLESEHPYSSYWWEWILNLRPIFYYVSTISGDIRSGISAFGNPLVYWAGAVCLICIILKKTRDKTLIFLTIAYMAQLLPWTFVGRTTYAYHYFPTLPFLTLIITYFFKNYVHGKCKYATYGYLIAVFIVFIMFYPVLSGAPIDYNFVKKYLEWLPRWQLI